MEVFESVFEGANNLMSWDLLSSITIKGFGWRCDLDCRILEPWYGRKPSLGLGRWQKRSSKKPKDTRTIIFKGKLSRGFPLPLPLGCCLFGFLLSVTFSFSKKWILKGKQHLYQDSLVNITESKKIKRLSLVESFVIFWSQVARTKALLIWSWIVLLPLNPNQYTCWTTIPNRLEARSYCDRISSTT